MSNKINEIMPIEYSYNGKSLTFIKPRVMAIVNVTPDSFYDGGKFSSTADILKDVEAKLKDGADIIDIGAASTRPGTTEVSEEEEWNRLEEPVKQILKNFPDCLLSIDTYRAATARKAAEQGAFMINDISGGNFDGSMFETVSELQIPYVLMHIQGNPASMQVNPTYSELISEVSTEFSSKINKLKQLGFTKIILDPGFGFGKTVEHNYQLLKHLAAFEKFGFPILAGLSRKSFINKVIETNPVTSLNGTTVLNTIALLNGSHLLRVHDVKEAKQAIELVEFYKNI